MKNKLIFIIILLIIGGGGFFIGKELGFEQAQEIQKFRGIESIKSDLKQKEIEIINSLLKGSAKIESSGGLFSNKNEKIIIGEIKNNALLAKVKDVKVKISFLSKTKSEIGNTEFIIYEFIEPQQSQQFKKKINMTSDVAEFNWNIIEAKAE